VAGQTSKDYSELREWLLREQSGDYIPPTPAYEKNGQSVVPVAFSPDMIDASGDYLLPAAATMIGIVPPDKQTTFVGMRAFLDTYGPLSFASGIWPPCFHISRFPDVALMERLRAVGSDRP
jgi:hypothetical protein